MTNTELETKYIHLFHCNDVGIPLRGIETSESWSKVVERFLERLEWIRTHNKHMNNGRVWDIKIFQIKQKFARLEVYVDTPEKIQHQVENIIGYAQGQAALTCECCSSVGNYTPTTGWMAVICDDCKEINTR